MISRQSNRCVSINIYEQTVWIEKSVDPDQLTSLESSWIYTVFKRGHNQNF